MGCRFIGITQFDYSHVGVVLKAVSLFRLACVPRAVIPCHPHWGEETKFQQEQTHISTGDQPFHIMKSQAVIKKKHIENSSQRIQVIGKVKHVYILGERTLLNIQKVNRFSNVLKSMLICQNVQDYVYL